MTGPAGIRNFSVPAGRELVVRGGGGDDRIEVPAGTTVRLTLVGGAGDDSIKSGGGNDTILGNGGADLIMARGGNDWVSGGAGRDYIDGGAGNDTLYGGQGKDTIYGLDGDDRISGGDDQDYLEGGRGADQIDGDGGNDILSGGRDADRIRGGASHDVIYTGAGADTVDRGSGGDIVYGQTGAGGDTIDAERTVRVEIKAVPAYIRVEGTPEFVARVQADLDMLAASPRGQLMIAAFERAHNGTLTTTRDELGIREYIGSNSRALDPVTDPVTGIREFPIEYNPTLDWIADGPPVAVLFHEMAHQYDRLNGGLDSGTYHGPGVDNGFRNWEREATGLPFDHDHNFLTPDHLSVRHPFALTDNGLRQEMGAPQRATYTQPAPSPGVGSRAAGDNRGITEEDAL